MAEVNYVSQNNARDAPAGRGGRSLVEGDPAPWGVSSVGASQKAMGSPGSQGPDASAGGGSGDTGMGEFMKSIMIAVVGKTKAGKTSYINAVTGTSLAVGHDRKSCTQDIQLASTELCGRSVTFLDTPGFDADMKGVISRCLEVATSKGATISGVIYLHRITDPDAESSRMTKMHMLRKLCGGGDFGNAILCTTMWGKIAEGVVRERRLCEDSTLWGGMIREGALVKRHQGQDLSASARGIAEALVRQQLAALQIQVESENEVPLGTSRGILRIGEVESEEAKRNHMGEIEKLRVELQAASTAKDEVFALMEKMKGEHTGELERLGAKLQAASTSKDGVSALLEKMTRGYTEETEQLRARLRAASAAKDEVFALMEEMKRKHTEEVERLRAGQQATSAIENEVPPLREMMRGCTEETEKLRAGLRAACAAKDEAFALMEEIKKKHSDEMEQLRAELRAACAAKDEVFALMEEIKNKHSDEMEQLRAELRAACAAKDEVFALMEEIKRKHSDEMEQLRAEKRAASSEAFALMKGKYTKEPDKPLSLGSGMRYYTYIGLMILVAIMVIEILGERRR